MPRKRFFYARNLMVAGWRKAMALTIDECKVQCRIDGDDPGDKQLLEIYIGAARRKAESYTNRQLYDDVLPANDPDGLVIKDDVKLALMLLVGHWYENREPVNIGNIVSALPFGFESLLDPYRFIAL